MRISRQPEDRFWSKVALGDGCWEWQGANRRGGRGAFRMGGRGTPMVSAYRVAWELMHGPIPGGLFVCHHCDNPACVRPSHLFLGTAKDNAQDMVRKGRRPSNAGGLNGMARLTDAAVVDIRRRYSSGEPVVALAREYRVSAGTVARAVRGGWTCVAGAVPADVNHRTHVSDADVVRIREKWGRGGVTQRALANEFGCHQSLVSRIVNGVWRRSPWS